MCSSQHAMWIGHKRAGDPPLANRLVFAGPMNHRSMSNVLTAEHSSAYHSAGHAYANRSVDRQ
jgi:hypothetical protein